MAVYIGSTLLDVLCYVYRIHVMNVVEFVYCEIVKWRMVVKGKH